MSETSRQQSTTQRMFSGLDLRRLSLFWRLVTAITSLAVVVVAGVTVFSINRERQTFETELESQAETLINTFSLASLDALYVQDLDQIEGLAERIFEQDQVLLVRIYDGNGRILTDAGDLLFASTLDTDPYGAELVASDGIQFQRKSDRLVAGQPIVAARQVLGAVHVELSTASLDAKVANVRNRGIAAGVIAVMLSLVVAYVISRSIAKPIEALVDTTRQIADGDFTRAIPPHEGSDEVSKLGNAIEFMRANLQELYTNLENKVQERTKELTAARKEAEEANRLKSEFLSTMSHELRTPLNAIIGFTEIQLSGMAGELNDEQKNYQQRVLANGEHLLALINDVLDLAKIEAGRLDITAKPFSIQSWLDDIVTLNRVLAEGKNLALESEVDNTLPATIYGDAERLKQITINLLSNAIKFTDKGKVTLKVSANGQSNWQLAVSDTGVGIPPHEQERIFDEFRQVDGSYQRVHSGTGLGLAIVLKLAQAMDGTVRVNSAIGRGSTFIVTLPLVAVPENVTS